MKNSKKLLFSLIASLSTFAYADREIIVTGDSLTIDSDTTYSEGITIGDTDNSKSDTSLTVSEGAKLTVTSSDGVASIYSRENYSFLYVYGTLDVTKSESGTYAIYISETAPKFTVGENATINATGDVLYATTNKNSKIDLLAGSTLNVDGNLSIKTGSSTESASTSSLYGSIIVDSLDINGGKYTWGVDSSLTINDSTSFNIAATTDIDFTIYNATVFDGLTMVLKGNDVTLSYSGLSSSVVDMGSLDITLSDGTALTISLENTAGVSFDDILLTSVGEGSSIVITDFADELLKIGDTTGIEISADGTQLTIDGVTIDITISGDELGDTWEFTSDGYLTSNFGVVPEPSTYAMIFGSLALGLAIYRRRK